MALKPVVFNISDVPEAFRGEYEKAADGSFVLKLEGAPIGYVPEADVREHKQKLTHFRDTNVELMKALGADSVDTALSRARSLQGLPWEKLEQLKKIDPARYEELQTKVQSLERAGAGSADDVQKLVSDALKQFSTTVVDPLKASLESERNTRIAAEKQRDENTFRTKIAEAAHNARVKSSAVEFIVDKARGFFTVENNELKPLPDKFSAEKPGDPLKVEEWIGRATRDYDFAFEASNGGGTSSSAVPGGGTVRNGKQLIVPAGQQADPRTLGANMDAIMKGDLKVVHQG